MTHQILLKAQSLYDDRETLIHRYYRFPRACQAKPRRIARKDEWDAASANSSLGRIRRQLRSSRRPLRAIRGQRVLIVNLARFSVCD